MIQNIYFTSDLHFGHKNILNYSPKRKEFLHCTDITTMDNSIIELWNSTVKKRDFIYFLGDFSFYNTETTKHILEKLNGIKFLIKGNHDDNLKGLENYFSWIGDIKIAKFTNNQYNFIDKEEPFILSLCHYPMLTWNYRNYGSCMVHGHCHSNIDQININSKELRVDVGIDSSLSNYNFISLNQLYSYFKSITKDKKFKDYISEKILNDKTRL